MNEAIEEKRGLGAYLERGREWLQEMGQRVRDQAELAAHGMASLVQGAARTMRAGLQTSTGDGFDALPAPDHSTRQQQTPALDHGQDERDQQRSSEEHTSELQSLIRHSYAVFCLKKKQHKNT